MRASGLLRCCLFKEPFTVVYVDIQCCAVDMAETIFAVSNFLA
jgi:hypothetical protein